MNQQLTVQTQESLQIPQSGNIEVGTPQIPLSPTSSESPSDKSSPSPNVRILNNNFVHKLHGMVIDKQYQHLISWNYSGTSFIVCNITEFSKDVLPKHFKHNNFSSFVRQLNMYGFHKVNKSPRGHRTLAENQIWEFSHAKFLRDRPDLLDDIKRKALESENLRRETGDLHAHITMMQVTQSDMMQRIAHLQATLSEVVQELTETRRRQEVQQQMIKNMMDHLQQNSALPPAFPTDISHSASPDIKNEGDRPPIYITSPEDSNNLVHDMQLNVPSNGPIQSQGNCLQPPGNISTSQAFQQNNFNRNGLQIQIGSNYMNHSNAANMIPTQMAPDSFHQYNQPMNHPLPPSPHSPLGMISDDELNSPIYGTNPHGGFRNLEYGADGQPLFNM
ncbi:hypothetical protein K493DRAFT_270309 [Basidiobolus meristosporus CBS 931.73]|uniref:HSF-type DNA-binding domain-containing protein n=1 Tax=Basidiobolus meristosporus CBS 931.73 TaxID=1314790 RepID=A0A1Y1X7L9_9FUNG|nr:hypothetical protein K493DRAFT_270309 [Basidiobolus meristosporus CBS 931.73]|eukprot:ORX81760.1 hypothetical protein K493DRAFT_270309 [Basidiobolus meristosporus CBS 931.73]